MADAVVYNANYVVEEGVVRLVRSDSDYDYIGQFRIRIEDTAQEVPDEVCQSYIDGAKDLILTRRHPYSDDPLAEQWETRYDRLAVEMAAAMWWKHGADGQTASRENGIYRAWDPADAYVPSGLLQRVVPIAAVV